MKQRQFVYVPALNPRTFMFFYFKGTSGRAYSFRTFPPAGGEGLSYAEAYRFTVDEILKMAELRFDAPTWPTSDHAFWRGQIAALNERYLQPARHGAVPSPDLSPGQPASRKAEVASDGRKVVVGGRQIQVRFPVIGLERLLAHPVKGAKPQDMERILSSPRSEDYVTWNVLQLLLSPAAAGWWPALLDLARADNPRISLPEQDTPALDPWRTISSPAAYEQRSRARMAASGDPAWRVRSANPKPVEGRTEVDLVADGRECLVFIEAKLESDISMATTYDPVRNQIIRNVDVLLETCGRRTPAFWILAKDRAPGRAYVQLIETYRRDPQILAAALPHRDAEVVATVARNLAILCWRDVLNWLKSPPDAVLAELRRRVG